MVLSSLFCWWRNCPYWTKTKLSHDRIVLYVQNWGERCKKKDSLCHIWRVSTVRVEGEAAGGSDQTSHGSSHCCVSVLQPTRASSVLDVDQQFIPSCCTNTFYMTSSLDGQHNVKDSQYTLNIHTLTFSWSAGWRPREGDKLKQLSVDVISEQDQESPLLSPVFPV